MPEIKYNELYKRVKEAAKFFAGNINDFAQSVGQNPHTFYGYLKATRQDNLWPLLPIILEKYPRLSRQWLYFGEGDMLDEPQTKLHDSIQKQLDAAQLIDALKERNAKLEAELDEERTLNRKLTARLLHETAADAKAAGDIAKASGQE